MLMCILKKGFTECVTVNSILTSYRGECFQTTFKFNDAWLELESHHFLHVCLDVLLLRKRRGKKNLGILFVFNIKHVKAKQWYLTDLKPKGSWIKLQLCHHLNAKCYVHRTQFSTRLTPSLLDNTVVTVWAWHQR